jgi:hypothetical protein
MDRRRRLTGGRGRCGARAAAHLGGGAPDPTTDPGTGIGSCVETFSPATLAARDFAFDGTVTAVNGDDVTFAVNDAFTGELDASVTLRAVGMAGASVTSVGGPTLTVGSRYLVAGDDGFAWACGFTRPYSEASAAEWAEALR